MQITYPFTDSTIDQYNHTIQGNNNRLNVQLSFTLGDTMYHVEPQPGSVPVEVPAKTLRQPGVSGSGLVPAAGTYGPHQDYIFMHDSVEYTYTVRELVPLVGSPSGYGVIEKMMPVGATVGQEGRMVVYKGCTALSDALIGNWTERLIRPFIITVNDLKTRESDWPSTGTVPTINTT